MIGEPGRERSRYLAGRRRGIAIPEPVEEPSAETLSVAPSRRNTVEWVTRKRRAAPESVPSWATASTRRRSFQSMRALSNSATAVCQNIEWIFSNAHSKSGDGCVPEARMQVQTTDRTTLSDPEHTTGDARRWLALPVLLAGAFLPILDFNVVNLALPAIRQDLGASSSEVQFVISTRRW
jgi:hypothetical protein